MAERNSSNPWHIRLGKWISDLAPCNAFEQVFANILVLLISVIVVFVLNKDFCLLQVANLASKWRYSSCAAPAR